MSASNKPIFKPNFANEQAILTAIVLFPTPPLPLLIAIICLIPFTFFNSGILFSFILTVYEKRVKSEDLPFFSELMTGLNKASVRCPILIVNKQKKTIENPGEGSCVPSKVDKHEHSIKNNRK